MSEGQLRARNVPTPAGEAAREKKTDGEENFSDSGRPPFARELLRMTEFGLYFLASCLAVHGSQLLGGPLYFINRDYYHAYMSFTKQTFALFINTLIQWFCPTTIRVSGEPEVASEMRLLDGGRLGTSFPARLIVMANHQIYTDWFYFWWISYTSGMHGHIHIILKESLKYVPVIGPGMLLYNFIFLARNWAKDKPRFQQGLSKLTNRHRPPMSGARSSLDPMWLLIFPEGTNLSKNGRNTSKKWAEKSGLADLDHALLPRSTGLHFCLTELKSTVGWIYDCTIAYEGIPRGQYGQDIFTLQSMFFQGRNPPSVNMYWRRFPISSIPIDDSKAFDAWLRARWMEKDRLLEQHVQTGRFPPSLNQGSLNIKNDSNFRAGYIETQVKQKVWFEFLLIFAPMAAFVLVVVYIRRTLF